MGVEEMDKFINEYEITEDLYIEQYSHRGYFWATLFFVFATAMFVINSWWIWCGVAFVFAMAMSFFAVNEYIKLKETYQQQLKDNNNIACSVRLEFNPTSVLFTNNYGAHEEIPYSAILKSVHKPNLIVFIIDRGYYISVKKDSFVEGSLSCFTSAMSVRGL